MELDIETTAFLIVSLGLLLASFFIPQRILDDWEMSILLFVVIPFLTWGGRLILKGKIG